MTTRTTIRAVAACAAICALSACAQNPAAGNKAGGETVVLKFASIDDANDNGQSYGPKTFIDSVDSLSGGQVKVQFEQPYGNGAVDAESSIVKAIANGQLDGGWPSVRSFANAGITGLQAVEAPMTIASYAAESDLVAGPVAQTLLEQLNDTGVVGLGLMVGPLRRPFAAQSPLLAPADWRGVPFRVFNSPIQTAAVEALDGQPVKIATAWPDEVAAGRLRGLEFDIPQYVSNSLTTEAGYVTANIVLWPKIFVLSMSQQRFDSLSEQQQSWVREAAGMATQASVTGTHDENTLAQQMCDKGAKFIAATPEQVAAMTAALQPVVDRLAADPTNGPILTDIQAIVARHPGPDVPSVPAGCGQGTVATATDPTIVPSETSTIPDGVYRSEITRDDVAAAGLTNGDGPAGLWTMTFSAGTYDNRCRPIANPGSDCGHSDSDGPLEVGDLRGTGNVVYFVPNAERIAAMTGCKLPPSGHLPDHCGPDDPYHATWTVDGDTMTFSGIPGLSIKPWQKIG